MNGSVLDDAIIDEVQFPAKIERAGTWVKRKTWIHKNAKTDYKRAAFEALLSLSPSSISIPTHFDPPGQLKKWNLTQSAFRGRERTVENKDLKSSKAYRKVPGKRLREAERGECKIESEKEDGKGWKRRRKLKGAEWVSIFRTLFKPAWNPF